MDHEEVAAETLPELVAETLLCVEQPGVDGRVLVDGHRVVGVGRADAAEALRGHEDRPECVSPGVRGELALLDARLEAATRRHDPHLDETHRLGLRAVPLRVLHPRPQGRSLDRAGMEDAAVATRVGVLECSLCPIRASLYVA